MSKKIKISLAQVIKAQKPLVDKAIIKKKLSKSPFSQPLQRLAHLAEISSKKATTTHKYYWLDNEDQETQESIDNQNLILGTIELRNKPKKAKKKVAAIKKSKVSKASKKTVKTNKTKVDKQKVKPAAKPKASFSNNHSSNLTLYTNWLNEKTNYKIQEELVVEKKKKPKKKKKSDVKISSNIQSKIDSSLKSKEEIATVALAKLYAKQGFIKKAIKTYEMLSLINPEKSSSFAPLIQELKKQL